MKICFVTYGNYDQHATLKRATGMAEPLQSLGEEVFLLLEDAPANREKVAIDCPSIKVYWHSRTSSFRAELRQKQEHIDYLGPDAIWMCGLGARNWVRKTSPKSVLLADHSELYSVVEKLLHRKAAYRLIEWLSCVAVDGHICASRHLYHLYSKRLQFFRSQNRPLYLPFAFRAGTTPGAVPKPPLASGEVKRIIYMGSFWKEYGIWEMLEALKMLRKSNSIFSSVLIGSGPELDPARNWVNENSAQDYISLPGYLPERVLAGYLASADVFLCPLHLSDQDRYRCPSKLFEYIPYRKPIVTRKVGEALNLLGNDYSYYYSDSTALAMSRAMNAALQYRSSSDAKLPEPALHSWDQRAKDFHAWHRMLAKTTSFHTSDR